MPPKATSATTSSKSSTSNPAQTPIQFVKGVGPRLGAIFQSRDVETVKDLLHFFPRAYEDRTKTLKISELVQGQRATIAVKVISARQFRVAKLNRSMLEVRASDETGTISFKWFHAPRGMEARFQPGVRFLATGTPRNFMNKPEITHPEITWDTASAGDPKDPTPDTGRIIPVYTEIEGVSTRVLRKILWEALQKYSFALSEDIPELYLRKHGLPKLAQAIREIHFPEKPIPQLVEFDTPAHWRLIYEEFFKFEYLVLRQRLRAEKQMAAPFGKNGGTEGARALAQLLPFKLTGDQGKAISEILEDLGQPHPMNRLIQGDVGSGKTAVALITAGCVLSEGGQAALMAPTEILAEQHYKNAVKLFGGRLNVALLVGKSTASERVPLLARLKAGEPILLIGTHALIEDEVEFKNLSYIMIDEQHRFGVEQRRTLRKKGQRVEAGQMLYPHALVLTATPIPRTLALTAYGDLSVSSIQELPPGRTPVKTHVVSDKTSQAKAYERIRIELHEGHQAYFIYPLVNESEAEGFTQLKSAVNEADRLQRDVFPEYKVGLLHGQQKADEKATIMEEFKQGKIQILVSTTVVEVGVDVPNATVMVIEHSERFGLSQLHQLRGRVGRGARQSYCFLFSHPRVGETSAMRLDVLEQTHDGFKIAEADLEIRGPGEFLGTRQAGGLPFRLAHLVRDREWLLKARDDAATLLKEDADLQNPENLALRKFYEREGSLQFDRLRTS